jgi:hypothetical protein
VRNLIDLIKALALRYPGPSGPGEVTARAAGWLSTSFRVAPICQLRSFDVWHSLRRRR